MENRLIAQSLTASPAALDMSPSLIVSSGDGVTLLYPDLRFPRLPTPAAFATTPNTPHDKTIPWAALWLPDLAAFLQRVFTASKMSPVLLPYFVRDANPGAFLSP